MQCYVATRCEIFDAADLSLCPTLFSNGVFSIELEHASQSVIRASPASLFRLQRVVFWGVMEPWAVAGVVHGSRALVSDLLIFKYRKSIIGERLWGQCAVCVRLPAIFSARS